MPLSITQAPLAAEPYHCAVTLRDDGEIVDFGVEMVGFDPHLYLRVPVVEEAGKLIGMVPKAEVDKLEAALSDLSEGFVDLQKRLATYEQAESAITALRALENPEPDPIAA